jgi:hypothetical protein
MENSMGNSWKRAFVYTSLGIGFSLAHLGCTGTESLQAISCLDQNDCPPGCQCTGRGLEIGACVIDIDEGPECGGTCSQEDGCPEGDKCKFERSSNGVYIFSCQPEGSQGTGGTGGSGGVGGAGGSGGVPLECDDPLGEHHIILDDDFDDADWEIFESHADGATVSIEPTGQAPSGGVDDSSYRSMTHMIETPAIGEHENCTAESCSYGVVVQHRYLAETYTPATEGALAYIDLSESRIITEPAFEGAAVGWNFVLWQDGTRYRQNVDASLAFRDSTWTGKSLCGLTAGDFVPEGLNLVDGGELVFGYLRSNSHTVPDSTQRNVHGIDDFRIVLVK